MFFILYPAPQKLIRTLLNMLNVKDEVCITGVTPWLTTTDGRRSSSLLLCPSLLAALIQYSALFHILRTKRPHTYPCRSLFC